MAIKVTPLYDRVLIRRMNKEERTATGLFIPDVAREKPQRGIVVSVGTGTLTADGRELPLKVKPGDHVVMTANVGDDVVLDGSDHVIVREHDLLAIVAD